MDEPLYTLMKEYRTITAPNSIANPNTLNKIVDRVLDKEGGFFYKLYGDSDKNSTGIFFSEFIYVGDNFLFAIA